jgi:hypothetical protein
MRNLAEGTFAVHTSSHLRPHHLSASYAQRYDSPAAEALRLSHWPCISIRTPAVIA